MEKHETIGEGKKDKTNETALSKRETTNIRLSSELEKVLVQGDLSGLNPEQRIEYYNATCKSLGLNSLTKPFDYINLNGKLTLYAKRDATDQLRKIHNVSIKITSRELIGDIYVITAQAKAGEREDESTGAVFIKGLFGDKLANAYMKAETKAKRRVTLSICGLGFLDETEIDTAEQKQTKEIKQPKPNTPSKSQLTRLYTLVSGACLTPEQMKQELKARYNIDSSTKLTIEQYNEVCKELQAIQKPKQNDVPEWSY